MAYLGIDAVLRVAVPALVFRRRARPRWRERLRSPRAPSPRVATLLTAGFRREQNPSSLAPDRTRRPVFRDCRSDRRETRAAGSPQRQHRFRRPRALPHSAGARLQVSTNTANGRRLGECRSAWLSDSLAAGRDPSAPSRQERHRAALLPHSQAEGAVRRDCRPGQPILVGLLV
jgi:hypothetical protein